MIVAPSSDVYCSSSGLSGQPRLVQTPRPRAPEVIGRDLRDASQGITQRLSCGSAEIGRG